VKHFVALLINPFVYDFAAYNFWSKPLGLLYIGSILRKNGFEVYLLDCMEPDEKTRKEDGRSHYLREKVEKPEVLRGIEKPLRRYGISEKELRRKLELLKKPDIVLITSLMTYWYTGSLEVARIVKEVYPESKTVLGGLYPTLCEEHARKRASLFDLILKKGELNELYEYIEGTFSLRLSFKPEERDLDTIPYPALDLYEKIDFVPIMTSVGCVFRCKYCSTPYLSPKINKRQPERVIKEIYHWRSLGVKRFVIYDDCFLYDKKNHAIPILKGIEPLSKAIEIFNPNALNAAFVDPEISELLFRSGFREVRIGLESVNPETQRKTGGKVDIPVFEKAVKYLKEAGFRKENIHVYLLAGLPFQSWEEVKEGIDYVLSMGCTPHIAEYAPCPHTEIFEKYGDLARFPIREEPLFQNNSLFPFASDRFTEAHLQFLKSYLRKRIQ